MSVAEKVIKKNLSIEDNQQLIEKSILDTKELLHDEDKEMIAIAREELRQHEI